MRRWSFCLPILPITSHRGCDHWTHQTLIRSTAKCVVCCKNACTVPGFETLTIWSSDLLKSGVTSTRESLTKQCISGMFDCMNVFEQKEATSSTNCNQHCAAWLSHVGKLSFLCQCTICCISETKQWMLMKSATFIYNMHQLLWLKGKLITIGYVVVMTIFVIQSHYTLLKQT